MHITFSKLVKYVPEWRDNNKLPDAEQFYAMVSVMDVADLLFLLDHFSEAGLEGDVEVKDVDTKQLKPIMEACGHLLPKYVVLTNLTNIVPGGLEDITIEDVVLYPYFLNLSAELLMKLAEQSSPNDDDEGNLNAPPVSETAL